MGKILLSSEQISKFNKLGSKNNPKFKCISNVAYKNEKQKIFLEIKNLKTGEKKIANYYSILSGSNPYRTAGGQSTDNESVTKKINKLGQETKGLKYKCLNPFAGKDKANHRKITIQAFNTKEIKTIGFRQLIRYNNPFFRGQSKNDEVIKIVNEIGKKSNPSFLCFDPMVGTNKHGSRKIKLKAIKSGEIKEVFFKHVKAGANPFRARNSWFRTDNELIEKIINDQGQKANPNFICVDPCVGFNSRRSRLVKIKCVSTGEIKITEMYPLKIGRNPFNKTQNRVELNEVHPQIEKMVSKLGFAIQKNYKLGKSEFIDFNLSHPKLKYNIAIEAKQSDTFHTYSKNQQKRYRQKASLKQHKIKKLLFVDPKGSHKEHGFISFIELSKLLVSELKING